MFTKVAAVLKRCRDKKPLPLQIELFHSEIVQELASMFKEDNPKNFDEKKFLSIIYGKEGVSKHEKE